MRDFSAPLLSFLNTTRQLAAVDLYTFDLKSGITLRYCNASDAVTFGGLTWLPAPAGITRSRIRWTTGVEVDTLDIDFQSDASILVAGTPLLAAAVNGLFDNCRVTLQRLFMQDWATPVDTALLFQGNTAPAEILRSAVHLTVKSDLERLNAMIPPNVYQASCVHSLYSAGCTVKPATYRASGTVSSVQPDGGIVTALGAADDYYQMGAIKFTSGPNIGLTRTVKRYANKVVYPTKAFPYAITASDAFTITPGCDKLLNGDCRNKYNNVTFHKAFPFIPVPETAA